MELGIIYHCSTLILTGCISSEGVGKEVEKRSFLHESLLPLPIPFFAPTGPFFLPWITPQTVFLDHTNENLKLNPSKVCFPFSFPFPFALTFREI